MLTEHYWKMIIVSNAGIGLGLAFFVLTSVKQNILILMGMKYVFK